MSKRAEEAAFNYACEHGTLGLNYNKIYDGVKYGYEQAEKDILDDAKQVVASFEQAFKQAEKDLGWHSIEESLPEETEYVTNNGCHQKWSKSVFAITTGNSVMICWTKDGEFFCDKDFHFPVNVKYWMPIPKLPEEE